jgi:DNA-directed RNA polymerase specialized sigma24 family protein
MVDVAHPSGLLPPAGSDVRDVARITDLGLLLDSAVVGDLEAAAAVYDRVSVSVYRMVLVVVGEAELAAEVCRLGFQQLWTAWSAVHDGARRPASAQTWVLMTMHRYAADHVTQRRGAAYRRPLGPAKILRLPRAALLDEPRS